MLKKAALAVFALVLGVTLAAPPKADAEAHVGVFLGAPVAYGAVVAAPAPYYGQPAYGYDNGPYYNGPYYNGPYYVEPPAPAYYGGYYYDGGRRYWRGDRHDDHWGRGDRWEHHRRGGDDDR